MSKRKSAVLTCAAALLAPAMAVAAPIYQFEPLASFGGGDGFIAPGERGYLATGVGNNERGAAYNPLTNRFYVASRTGGIRIAVLDGDTGADVQVVPFTQTGGTFAINQIRVADDGAIYVANLTTNASTSPFNIYRYADEAALLSGAAPTVAFSGNPAAVRFGDNLNIRGAGPATQIIAGAGGTSNTVAIFSTPNGADFTAETFTLPGTANGDAANGIAFGAANTFYAKQVTDSLRLYSYVSGVPTATLLQEYNGGSSALARVGPIDVDVVNTLLSGISIPRPGVDSAVLYDTLNPLVLSELDIQNFLVDVDNANVAGAVDFGNGRVYFLDTNNGILAMSITLIPEPAAMTLAGLSAIGLLARRRRA